MTSAPDSSTADQRAALLSGCKLVSRLEEDGQLVVELIEEVLPAPSGDQVIVRVDAAPINPSDLGIMFASADLTNAAYSGGKIVAQMPEASRRNMSARFGKAMPIGNEGAGVVVATGDTPEARALLGQLVTSAAGGMYAQHRLLRARECVPAPEGASAEQAASMFVNPMTALAFVETMRRGGHTAIVHTAAASALGQMLVRICREDGIGLVNIVRSESQVALLRELGAVHVLSSTDPGFYANLCDAIRATSATMVFDAIGGGALMGQILSAMERIGRERMDCSRYGSSVRKQGYIYGALDTAPMQIVGRDVGFAWDVGGWLLTPFLETIEPEAIARMRARVAADIATTFATSYTARVPLAEVLNRDLVLRYNARRTGEKFIIKPNA
jgi:NADPH:quinone reductase-like Zn-dependent oxidoreductase